MKDINWDLHYIGEWPAALRLAIALSFLIIVPALGYYLDVSAQLEDLKLKEAKETELRSDYKVKASRAVMLPVYEVQIEKMNTSFGSMLKRLPSKSEIPDLLTDVSQTGLANGLEFRLFQPGKEDFKDFYVELPIAVNVIGTYHQIGNFISGLASLPRIVSIHDIEISKIKTRKRKKLTTDDKAINSNLIMRAVVKTYRYLDGDELRAIKKKNKEK